jgi:hypothetical protein
VLVTGDGNEDAGYGEGLFCSFPQLARDALDAGLSVDVVSWENAALRGSTNGRFMELAKAAPTPKGGRLTLKFLRDKGLLRERDDSGRVLLRPNPAKIQRLQEAAHRQAAAARAAESAAEEARAAMGATQTGEDKAEAARKTEAAARAAEEARAVREKAEARARAQEEESLAAKAAEEEAAAAFSPSVENTQLRNAPKDFLNKVKGNKPLMWRLAERMKAQHKSWPREELPSKKTPQYYAALEEQQFKVPLSVFFKVWEEVEKEPFEKSFPPMDNVATVRSLFVRGNSLSNLNFFVPEKGDWLAVPKRWIPKVKPEAAGGGGGGGGGAPADGRASHTATPTVSQPSSGATSRAVSTGRGGGGAAPEAPPAAALVPLLAAVSAEGPPSAAPAEAGGAASGDV